MSFRHAWAFLTRLPGGAHPADERALGMSVPWFPVVGAVIGLMIGMVWLGLNELVSPLTSARMDWPIPPTRLAGTRPNVVWKS